MLSTRQFIGAATTALSLITGAVLLALAGHARAQGSAPACDAAGEIALLPSPWAPWKGVPLRVMLVTEKPLQGELSLIERMIRTNYEFRRLAERYDEVNRNIYRIE